MPQRPPMNTTPPLPPGQRFKAAIEKAKQDGVDTESLMLRLTLGDVSRLKRDRAIPAEEISFAGDVMRYLGVKVVGGDIETSALIILQT